MAGLGLLINPTLFGAWGFVYLRPVFAITTRLLREFIGNLGHATLRYVIDPFCPTGFRRIDRRSRARWRRNIAQVCAS